MSAFDLPISLENARRRLGRAARPSGRRPRRDRGHSRLDARVVSRLAEALGGYERPVMAKVLGQIAEWCRDQGDQGLKSPSRATLYKMIRTLPVRKYRVADLPPAVRDALYNLGAASDVPGHQLAFYCFNYGNLEAMSFAAGLPWLALHQALHLPGYRARSRGLLESVARVRGL